MSRKLSVTQQRRGPTLRLGLAAMAADNETTLLFTETFDIDGLAQIIGIVHYSRKMLALRIKMKKTEAAKNYTVTANVTFENSDKQFLCSDEWFEVTLSENLDYQCSYYTGGGFVFSYAGVVDISVHATLTATSVVYKLLYEDNEYTDFNLRASDGSVAVHKAILAVHGDTFKTMLRGDWKETNEGSINLNGVTVQTLRHLKEYMYLGTLPDEGIESLLLISVPYLMERLETDCINKLIKSLEPEKFNDLVEFALQNNLLKLVKALVLNIPDEIVNSIRQLNINEGQSNDTEKS